MSNTLCAAIAAALVTAACLVGVAGGVSGGSAVKALTVLLGAS